MNRATNLLLSIGLGAGAMYYFDPQLGRRRRALLRDQFARVCNEVCNAYDVTLRDLRNRTQGLAAEVCGMLREDHADDRVIRDRVRSKMGRYVSHAHAIQVTVNNGHVTLQGPILRAEVPGLLASVRSVRGVQGIENRLDVHDDPGDVSALQGGTMRTGEQFELLQGNWSPTARLFVGGTGAALLTYSLSQRFPMSCAFGTLGAGLLMGSLSSPQRVMETLGVHQHEGQHRGGHQRTPHPHVQPRQSSQRTGAGEMPPPPSEPYGEHDDSSRVKQRQGMGMQQSPVESEADTLPTFNPPEEGKLVGEPSPGDRTFPL